MSLRNAGAEAAWLPTGAWPRRHRGRSPGQGPRRGLPAPVPSEPAASCFVSTWWDSWWVRAGLDAKCRLRARPGTRSRVLFLAAVCLVMPPYLSVPLLPRNPLTSAPDHKWGLTFAPALGPVRAPQSQPRCLRRSSTSFRCDCGSGRNTQVLFTKPGGEVLLVLGRIRYIFLRVPGRLECLKMQITVNYTHLPFDKLFIYRTSQVRFCYDLCARPGLMTIINFPCRMGRLENWVYGRVNHPASWPSIYSWNFWKPVMG